MTKDKCILVVGDDIKISGSNEFIMQQYGSYLQTYIQDKRPSKLPSIWKCIKEPKQ